MTKKIHRIFVKMESDMLNETMLYNGKHTDIVRTTKSTILIKTLFWWFYNSNYTKYLGLINIDLFYVYKKYFQINFVSFSCNKS